LGPKLVKLVFRNIHWEAVSFESTASKAPRTPAPFLLKLKSWPRPGDFSEGPRSGRLPAGRWLRRETGSLRGQNQSLDFLLGWKVSPFGIEDSRRTFRPEPPLESSPT